MSTTEILTQLVSPDSPESARQELFQQFVESPITPEKLATTADFLRSHMLSVDIDRNALDTCGTGGSGQDTINTSTTIALLLTTLGAKVAKHGNRSASGKCGSFDLLEAAGVNIEITPEKEKKLFDQLGLVFLYARTHHPIMGRLAPLRKAYGQRTIFNLVGPLCSPARVKLQLLGVSDLDSARLITGALHNLATDDERALVVHALDGLDEISLFSDTLALRVTKDEIQESTISPTDFNIKNPQHGELEGGETSKNLETFQQIIHGKGTETQKNFIALNAAHALQLDQPDISIQKAFDLCMDALATDRCAQLLSRYQELS